MISAIWLPLAARPAVRHAADCHDYAAGLYSAPPILPRLPPPSCRYGPILPRHHAVRLCA